MAEKPIEIFCPICGFKTYVNNSDETIADLSRAEKIKHIQKLQKSERPFFLCNGCENPKATSEVLEIR